MRSAIYLTVLSIALITKVAFAASCPYCNQKYGEGPAGSSYIASIRASHEAECSARYNNQGSQSNTYNSNSDAEWEKQYQQMKIEENQNTLRKRQQLKLQQQREEESREYEEAQRKNSIFQQNKSDLMSSLKSGNIRTLKTKEVPLPGKLKKRIVSKKAIRNEQIKDLEGKGNGLLKSGVDYLKKGFNYIVTAKNNFKDWVYLRTFDETFNQIPIIRGLRSFQSKTGSWYRSMKELTVGIYSKAMGNFEKGVGEVGSDATYTDSDGESVDDIGNKAREQAGKMVQSELEAKATF